MVQSHQITRSFYMKKSLFFSLVAVFAGMGAANAATGDVCTLIASMQGVFRILRTLAFVGAGFMIAGWAWGYISSGKIGDKGAMDELKGKGTALLVGFTLLFGIGIVLQFLGPISQCANLANW